MKRVVFGLFCCLLLSACQSGSYRLYPGPEQPASDVVQLEVPHTVQVIAVDAKKLKLSGRIGQQEFARYTLLPGKRDLTLRYHEIWPVGDDDHQTVQSREVALAIQGDAGQAYRIVMERPQTIAAAEVFAEAPTFSLESLGPAATSADGGAKPMLTSEANAQADASGPEASDESTIPEPKTVPAYSLPVSGPEGIAPEPPAELDELKRHWKAATAAEKKAFRKWIVDH